MKKIHLILILAFTAIILASFVIGGSRVLSSSLDDIKDKIGEAGDRNDNIADEIERVNNKLSDRQKELDELTAKYTQMLREKQQNNDELQAQLDDLDDMYNSILELKQTIDDTQAEYDEAVALFYKRAAIASRYSNYSPLKLFTESRSIFTYTDLTRLVSNMLEADRDDMERLTYMKRDLENKKAMAEAMSVDMQAAIAEKEAIIAKIKADQEILEEDMITSRKAIEQLEIQEDQLEQESAQLSREIKELRDEYDRILEEQRRAKEEAERKAREAAEKAAREQAEKEAAEQAEKERQEREKNMFPEDESQMVFPAPEGIRISSPYGWRIHPVYKTRKFHNGIDIAAPGGTDILAALSGTVTKARWSDSYGWYVQIYHGDGMTTLYGHASKLLCKEGEYVERGQVIALVGTTGVSTGNHLHFEVRIDGDTRDPMDYLPKFF